MTTTNGGPATEFRPKAINPQSDAPDTCPGWCQGHDPLYARDFGWLETQAEYDAARADFRMHRRNVAERLLNTISSYTGAPDFPVVRPGGGSWDVSISEREDVAAVALVELYTTMPEPGSSSRIHVTAGEARSLAAQLSRAADLLDAEEEDR